MSAGDHEDDIEYKERMGCMGLHQAQFDSGTVDNRVVKIGVLKKKKG